MSKKQKLGAGLVFAMAVIGFLAWRVSHSTVAVLQPRGTIGAQEKHLIIIAVGLSMIVVVPVYFMLFYFAWKYREDNQKSKYEPELDGSRIFESIWWGVPLAIILTLSVITFRSSHQLDPFKPLSAGVEPVTIQAVSLQWKWLFIYPKEAVASVNYVDFPVNTPVKFEVTSDAPMNSFWIPQLGGQIYAMSGMATNLNLKSSKIGDYRGVSANISGQGFSDMHFTARADSPAGFKKWLNHTQSSSTRLSTASYAKLAAPSVDNRHSYSSVQNGLFNQIVAKYGAPAYFNPEAHL